ncbi:phage late control D family protein, partial [Escherichia coli]|nr:phage late control D family protein [Escherichia coli]EJY0960526.1 phage late control D family protein [Escherichia coli]
MKPLQNAPGENTMKELSVTVPSPDIDITINNNTLANLTERLMT